MSQKALIIEVDRTIVPLADKFAFGSRLLTKPRLLAAVFLLMPVLTFIVLRCVMSSTDPDYWWHVRTGQYIFETGTVPKVDLYSYTVPDHQWVAHEWLTDLLFYVVYRQFGYVGNVALFALFGASIWLIVYVTCRWRGMGQIGAVVLMGWGYAMATTSISTVRPQVLTALFLAISAMLLTRYKQGYSRSLWLFPPLFALWVNLHGGYVIGLLLLGLTIVGEVLRRLFHSSEVPLKPLLISTTISLAATLANPSGIEALLYPASYLGSSNASMQYIDEWQSPNFHEVRFLIFAASLLLAFILGIGRRPMGPTEVLWVFIFALMSLQSVRHIPLYAVVVTPLIGARLQAEIPALRSTLEAWRRPALLSVTWIVLVASILIIVVSPDRRSTLQLGYEPNSADYPSGAVNYLNVNELAGNVFNEYDWGGYLIYKLYSNRRVFIDGRADVYGDEFIEDYMSVSRLRPNWRQVLDKYDIRVAIVRKETPLATVLADDKSWQELYSGKVEQLFARQTP